MASGKGNITKMLSEISEQPRVLAGFNSLNAGCLESLSDEMRAKSIKHVIFAARGTSYHAGLYGQYVLAVKCGMPASAALPSCVTLYESAPFTEDDLVIGVSQSGQAADVLEVLEKAKKCGALTAAITNDGSSPVAACAKYHIDCGAGEEVSVAATKTFTAQMSGVLLLAAHISGDKGITEAFERLPDKVKETEDMCVRDIDAYAERYINTKDGFIVSRGFMYPVALEAALKMQETCYVRMKGYSAADFMHGPIAQTDADTSVIVLAPSGRTFDDCVHAAGRIRKAGGNVLTVTDNRELAGSDPCSVLLPDTGSELTSPFVFAVFAQMLAERLSCLKGLDPDKPRGLSKITVTK